MFTKYMFNSLVFNPGYAGSKEYLSIGLLHRTQWYEIDGAPITQSLTAHTPLRNDRVGVGFSVVNDIIGPSRSTGANLSYAYRIPMGKLKFSFGLQAGVENYHADWSNLNIEDPDVVFDENVNKVLPNFGAGIFLYNQNFYLGLSCPHLVEYDLRNNAQLSTDIYARQVRHYYFTTGAAIPLSGDQLIFKPSILVKNVGLDKSLSKLEEFKDIGAPNEFEVDLSLLFNQALWVGAAFRSSFAAFGSEKRSGYDSADLWVSYVLKNGFRIGAAYDYPITELSTVTSGAFEIMLGYEFDFHENKTVSPRYF